MRTFRITTSTTTTIADESGQMASLRLVVAGSPSGWIITVQNKESPAKVFYATEALNAPVTIQVPFPQEGDRTVAVPMIGGIDVVTSGTPGVLVVWIEWRKTQI
jgi:hypothetical protein